MTTYPADAAFPRWKLDRTSAVPLHLQIERRLQELIRRPPYSAGAFLPDELTLASRLGVSRGTVRESILHLVQQGLLERRKGVGTRVVQSRLLAWISLTGEMRRKGIEVQSFLLRVTDEPAQGRIAEALSIAPGTQVKCLDQVRGWDDRPVLQSRSWFHPRLKLTGQEDFKKPLYELIRTETGMAAVDAREEFLAITADRRIAQRLKVDKGSPLLLRRRTSLDAKERPIDYAEIHYDTAGISLTITSRREALAGYPSGKGGSD